MVANLYGLKLKHLLAISLVGSIPHEDVASQYSCDNLTNIYENALEINQEIYITNDGHNDFVADKRRDKAEKLIEKCENYLKILLTNDWSDSETHKLISTILLILAHSNNNDLRGYLYSFIQSIPNSHPNKLQYLQQLSSRFLMAGDVKSYNEIVGDGAVTVNEASIESGRLTYRVETPSVLTEQFIDISTGNYLIVIGHPLCGFSQRFFAWYKKNESDLKIPKGSLITLASVRRKEDLTAIHSYQTSETKINFNAVLDTREWPIVLNWATPSFYFFVDGELVVQLIGWQGESSADEFRQALLKIREIS